MKYAICAIFFLACSSAPRLSFHYVPYGSGSSYGYTSRTTGETTYVVTFYGHPGMPRGLAANWALQRAAEIAWRQAHDQRFAAEINTEDRDTGGVECQRRRRSEACVESRSEVATVSVRLLADHNETRAGDAVYIASEVLGGNYQAAR